MLRASALRSVPLAIGYWTGIAGRRLRRNTSFRILTFHGTPAESARELERQLRYLRRQFELVPLHSPVSSLAAGYSGHSRQLALTFDDGLRSNVRVAYPILRKLGIPATFFVCPGLIEQRAWLWNVEARQRLRSLEPGALQALTGELGVPADPEQMVEWMKTLALATRMQVETRVREASRRFQPTPDMHERCDVADWDELRSLDPKLVTIGSHTLTHPILSRSTDEELESEIAGSRLAAETRLQRAVDLFAYPNGDQNERVLGCVRKHYRAAVTTVQTWVQHGCDLYLLPRVDAPRGAIRLCWNMHLPAYVPCAS